MKNTPTAQYRMLFETGELQRRVDALFEILSRCTLCPWKCGVNRLKGKRGRCKAPSALKVAKALAHFGEEPPVSGTTGSGAIFFSHCNLQCCFCQNYQISQQGTGTIITHEELAEKMLALQTQGCHNINLVSPTHFLPHIIRALCLACAHGLSIPIIYNSNGYENPETLQILNGIVDIYLPDAKYAEDDKAMYYSKAEHYTAINQVALQEMAQQVGNLKIDSRGIAIKGIIVRHLVLPHNQSGTEAVLKAIKSTLGTQVSISLMGQYLPAYMAPEFEHLGERITKREYNEKIKIAEALGFENGWIQNWDSIDGAYLPDFHKDNSWN